MAYENYECMKVKVDQRVAFVTIDYPPINLLDLKMMKELNRLGKELEGDSDVRVIVFQSSVNFRNKLTQIF